jgi:hypothetical protein
MTDIRMINHDDLLAINDASTYVELEDDGCINSDLEILWNSLPSLSDVRECLEAVERKSIIRNHLNSDILRENPFECVHCGNTGSSLKFFMHKITCPVMLSRNVLEKIGG